MGINRPIPMDSETNLRQICFTSTGRNQYEYTGSCVKMIFSQDKRKRVVS